jgi:HlyD family secretion protein
MNLRNKKTVAIFVIILIVVVFLMFRFFHKEGVSIAYKTAKVDKGDILSYVTATGTVNPVTMVEVGSQISGTIKDIYVDFNSEVKKGEALAQIDPTPFEAQVKHAEADLKKASADAELAKTIMKANEELYKKRLISKEEYDDSKVKYQTSVAALEQAKASLEIVKSNLYYTTIRSPIDGIVVSRNVNVGQTVAASFQAPTLFLIAEGLVKMKLDTNVSEADIGKIKEGQGASFIVDAYPDQTFKGKVWQIRNAPIIKQNVVTYNVVLLIDNEDLKLKPGMTAEVKILVAYKKDVLRVPTAALRFVPPPFASIDEKSRELNSSSVVWIPLENGKLKAVSVSPGISDDAFTEILDGNLREGEKVVVEATEKGVSGSEPLGPIVLPKPQRF